MFMDSSRLKMLGESASSFSVPTGFTRSTLSERDAASSQSSFTSLMRRSLCNYLSISLFSSSLL